MPQQNQQEHVEPVIEPLVLTIQEVADALALSRAKVYRMLDDRCPGGIPVTRFQRSVRVRVADLRRWVEQHQNDNK